MTSLRTALRDQRGSALLAALALSVVMTIMGLALFDLGRIENALVLANKTDAQAFEIAQAGIERAMDRLRRTLNAEQALGFEPQAASGPQLGWADGYTESGTTVASLCQTSCSTSALTAATSAYIPNTTFAGGSYQIAFQPLLVATVNAAPFGQNCTPDRDPIVNPATAVCQDMILVRSTGTMADSPPGYTGTRTIQVLLRAAASGGIGGGITVGSQTRFVSGNVNIYGSISVIDAPSSATQAWQFRGGANQQNNWSGLPTSITRLLRPRQLICPPGRTCTSDADKVESLDATLAVRVPLDSRAVDINSGSAFAGQPGDSASYGSGTTFDPVRKGKGPLNGVFVADGCVMPCDQNGTYVAGDPASKGSFTGRVDQVHVDGSVVTNPYPPTALTSLPQLTDPTTIANTTYTHYACALGSSCAGTTGGTQEFFVSKAGTRTVNITINGTSPATDVTVATGVTTVNKTTGAVSTNGVICFNRTNAPAKVTAPTAKVLEFFENWTSGTPCSTAGAPGPYTSTQNPLMVYMQGTLEIGGDIQYNGAAVFLVAPGSAACATSGGVSYGVCVSNNIINGCVAGGGDACSRKFLVDPRSPGTTDMLSVLTTGASGSGNMAFGGNAGDTLMGMFYAGVPNAFAAGGEASFSHQVTVVGGVTASQLLMTQVPNFYQVPGLIVPELFFGTGSAWSISAVGGFWRICAPGNPATSSIFPTTATGVCGYN
jgi:Tfp pilus assembly protein PilX